MSITIRYVRKYGEGARLFSIIVIARMKQRLDEGKSVLIWLQ